MKAPRWSEGEAYGRDLLARGGGPEQEFSINLPSANMTVHTRPHMVLAEGKWHLMTLISNVGRTDNRATVTTRCGVTASDPPIRAPYMDVRPPAGIECEECVTLPPFWP